MLSLQLDAFTHSITLIPPTTHKSRREEHARENPAYQCVSFQFQRGSRKYRVECRLAFETSRSVEVVMDLGAPYVFVLPSTDPSSLFATTRTQVNQSVLLAAAVAAAFRWNPIFEYVIGSQN